MQIKNEKYKDLRLDCDFWYDLTDGGYIDPNELLDQPTDATKVMAAIAVVREFQEVYEAACEEVLEDEDED